MTTIQNLLRPRKSRGRVIIELEKWDGENWVPDDGLPGLAFSGAEVEEYDRKRQKIGFHSSVPEYPALRHLAAMRSVFKYKKSHQKELT